MLIGLFKNKVKIQNLQNEIQNLRQKNSTKLLIGIQVINHSQGVKISYQFLLANILKSSYVNGHHN